MSADKQGTARALLDDFIRSAKSGPNQKFTFLLMGRTGVGKSSSVNSLMGKMVAPVGDYEPTTRSIEAYDAEIDGVKFTVIDTPGLCDELEERGNDERYLQSVKAQVPSFDCLWFVTRLDDTRVSSDEKRGISLITRAFGAKVWERGIIIFTFAGSIPERYHEALAVRTRLIREEIERDTSLSVASDVPSVAVDNTKATLPDGTLWLPFLYTKIWSRISSRGAIPFFMATASSVMPAPRSSAAGGTAERAAEPRILLTPEQKREVTKHIDAKVIPGLAGLGAVVGAAFGPVGAAIGGALGAAIGVIAWLFD